MVWRGSCHSLAVSALVPLLNLYVVVNSVLKQGGSFHQAFARKWLEIKMGLTAIIQF